MIFYLILLFARLFKEIYTLLVSKYIFHLSTLFPVSSDSLNELEKNKLKGTKRVSLRPKLSLAH